ARVTGRRTGHEDRLGTFDDVERRADERRQEGVYAETPERRPDLPERRRVAGQVVAARAVYLDVDEPLGGHAAMPARWTGRRPLKAARPNGAAARASMDSGRIE